MAPKPANKAKEAAKKDEKEDNVHAQDKSPCVPPPTSSTPPTRNAAQLPVGTGVQNLEMPRTIPWDGRRATVCLPPDLARQYCEAYHKATANQDSAPAASAWLPEHLNFRPRPHNAAIEAQRARRENEIRTALGERGHLGPSMATTQFSVPRSEMKTGELDHNTQKPSKAQPSVDSHSEQPGYTKPGSRQQDFSESVPTWRCPRIELCIAPLDHAPSEFGMPCKSTSTAASRADALPILFASYSDISDKAIREELYWFLAKPSKYIKDSANFLIFEAKGADAKSKLQPKEGTKPLAGFNAQLTPKEIEQLDCNELPKRVAHLALQSLGETKRDTPKTLQIICPLDLDNDDYSICSDGTILDKNDTVITEWASAAMRQALSETTARENETTSATPSKQSEMKTRHILDRSSPTSQRAAVTHRASKRAHIKEWCESDLKKIAQWHPRQRGAKRVVYQGAYTPHFWRPTVNKRIGLVWSYYDDSYGPDGTVYLPFAEESQLHLETYWDSDGLLVNKDIDYARTLRILANHKAFQHFGADETQWHNAIAAEAALQQYFERHGVRICGPEDILWRNCKTLWPEDISSEPDDSSHEPEDVSHESEDVSHEPTDTGRAPEDISRELEDVSREGRASTP